MTDRSPTRREFLSATGVGGSVATGFPVASWNGHPVASWGNVTDAVPDHPFVPTADERWSLDLGDDGAYLTGPVEGTLYARTAGVAHAIATDGTRRWRFEVEGDYPGVRVAPESGYSLLGRTVYVTDDDHVYALDPDDGSVRWRYEDARRPLVAAVLPRLVVAYHDAHVGRDDELVGLSTVDGSERWRVALDDGRWASPHFDGEAIYVGTVGGTVYAIDPAVGAVRWRVEPLDGGEDDQLRLVAADSTDDLLLAWRSEAGTLLALETANGNERWRLDTDSEAYDLPGTVRDETVYLREKSSLRVLSAADGSERWRFDGESVLSWPWVVGETVYVGNEDGLWALSVETGHERWRSEAAAIPAGVAEGTLVATTTDYSMYGFSTADGRLRWQYDPGDDRALLPHVRDDAIYLSTESGALVAVSDPGPTPVSDALRTVASPAGLAVGGLLGGALAAGAYRRRTRRTGGSDSPDRPTFEDFELVEPVAEADHAAVHDARAPDGTRVALKRLPDGEIARADFEAAVETWADLDVPGALAVREWGTDPVPWVATEYATGGDLATKGGDLTVAERARVVATAAETVHRAHREGVTHGRLVPGNVLFAPDGVRVGDWRLAAELRSPPEGYRPPESGSDSGSAGSEAADAYQLAAMARDLLGDDERSDELRDVLRRALAADPADRYDSALKFADALRWAVRE
jgi:outer membrane protein assembly factor BamB